VHSADGWREILEPVVSRYRGKGTRLYFRGDAAFANPEIYEFLEVGGMGYAIRFPANRVLRHAAFAANAVRLQLHALAYNLGNLMRTLAMPKAAEPWSLTSLREKLIKIGAKVVSHGRYVN
jgi:hypothetical protein